MSDELKFIETDPDKIINEIINDFESISGRKLGDADPVQLYIRWMSGIIIQEREMYNNNAKMNLRKYAKGEYLYELADLLGCEPLSAKAAETTMRFYLSKKPANGQIIPKGTRISVNDLFFETTEQLTVYSDYGDVIAVCTTKGTAGNDFEPGEITELVDIFPYYSRCENITTSNGGTDAETEDELRERMRLTPDSYSVAGPVGGYEYIVKSVSSDIIDVVPMSLIEGNVDIYFLMSGGELPTSELIADVLAAVSEKKVRPLADKVNVYAPSVRRFNIKLTYYINKEDENRAKEIDEAVGKAVDNYVLWQKSKIGRDINPSKLHELIMRAGAKRVEIVSPVYTAIENTVIALAFNIDVVSGGVEND
ncbi:MAG: baseplate J/gp47 family protein [Clostridia bacterium]|nr:baseplate J/gp47 family protein [Clostridia bacterium]